MAGRFIDKLTNQQPALSPLKKKSFSIAAKKS